MTPDLDQIWGGVGGGGVLKTLRQYSKTKSPWQHMAQWEVMVNNNKKSVVMFDTLYCVLCQYTLWGEKYTAKYWVKQTFRMEKKEIHEIYKSEKKKWWAFPKCSD